MTTSLIKALPIRFPGDFSACFALTSAFCAFNIVKVDFFALGTTNFIYAFNTFFITKLAFFKSATNRHIAALTSFSSYSFAFLKVFVACLTLLLYLYFSFAFFFTFFFFINTLALITYNSK
jgi:hypothetical protein